MTFDFHPEARAEFVADVEWYDEREWGVGVRFAAAVREAIADAIEWPQSWAAWPGLDGEQVVRSKRVTGFPHRVVYLVMEGRLVIVAVAHPKRRPGYWRHRLAD